MSFVNHIRLLALSAMLGAVFALAGGSASADSIGPDCGAGNCLGVIYTLENLGNQDGGSALNDIWRVKLTANTTSYTGSDADWISGVAMKIVSSGGDITNVSLFETNAPGTWTPGEGNVNTCTGGNDGFACAETTDQLALADGTTWHWTLDITVDEGTAFVDPSSIQIQYFGINPANGKLQNQGITSANIELQTPPPPPPPPIITTPEPASLALIGFGLIGLGVFRKRRRAL